MEQLAISKLKSKSRELYHHIKTCKDDEDFEQFYEHFPRSLKVDIGNYLHAMVSKIGLDESKCRETLSTENILANFWKSILPYKNELRHDTFRVHMIVVKILQQSMDSLVPYPSRDNRRQVRPLTNSNLSQRRWDSMSSVSRPSNSRKMRTREFVFDNDANYSSFDKDDNSD